VWSRVKNIAFLKKNIVFPKTHYFPTCALFIPLFWNEKLPLISFLKKDLSQYGIIIAFSGYVCV